MAFEDIPGPPHFATLSGVLAHYTVSCAACSGRGFVWAFPHATDTTTIRCPACGGTGKRHLRWKG